MNRQSVTANQLGFRAPHSLIFTNGRHFNSVKQSGGQVSNSWSSRRGPEMNKYEGECSLEGRHIHNLIIHKILIRQSKRISSQIVENKFRRSSKFLNRGPLTNRHQAPVCQPTFTSSSPSSLPQTLFTFDAGASTKKGYATEWFKKRGMSS